MKLPKNKGKSYLIFFNGVDAVDTCHSSSSRVRPSETQGIGSTEKLGHQGLAPGLCLPGCKLMASVCASLSQNKPQETLYLSISLITYRSLACVSVCPLPSQHPPPPRPEIEVTDISALLSFAWATSGSLIVISISLC